MSPILQQLCSTTYGASDLHRQIALLQECLEKVLYDTHTSTDASVRENAFLSCIQEIGSHEDVQALALCASYTREFTAHTLADVMESLKQEAERLPVMTLYVPVSFNAQATKIVGTWCRENIDTNLMLEMHIDPDVTGGCAFVFNDTYYDYSLRNALRTHKGTVARLMDSYA